MGMTIASNVLPHWVSFSVTADTGNTFYQNIGLHKSCSSESSPHCRTFPTREDCSGEERYFCSMWRSTGFLMSLAMVVELATLVTFLIVMGGGKAKRESGWKVLGGLMTGVAAIQFSAMTIVVRSRRLLLFPNDLRDRSLTVSFPPQAYLLDTDEKFSVPGWALDKSWVLCTVSGGMSLLCVLGLVMSAFVLPPEDGYEFLVDPLDS